MRENKGSQKVNSVRAWLMLGCLLGICLVAVFVDNRLSFAVSSTNQISVMLKDGQEKIEGAKIELYQVARNVGHEMKLAKAFAKTDITWKQIERQPRISAEIADSYVLKMDASAKPTDSAVTGEDGKVNFRVEDGVYLVRYAGDDTSYDRTVEMAPFLVAVPVTGDKGETVRKVECRAKCSLEQNPAPANIAPPTSTDPEEEDDGGAPPPESRAAVETDEENIAENIETTEIGDPDTARANKLLSDKEKSKNRSGRNSQTSSSGSSTTRTGDRFPLMVCLTVMITSGVMLFGIYLWKRKRRS